MNTSTTVAASPQIKESTVHVHFASDPFSDPQGMRPGTDMDFHLRPVVERHIRRKWDADARPEVPELVVEGYRFKFLFLRANLSRTRLSRSFRVFYWKL